MCLLPFLDDEHRQDFKDLKGGEQLSEKPIPVRTAHGQYMVGFEQLGHPKEVTEGTQMLQLDHSWHRDDGKVHYSMVNNPAAGGELKYHTTYNTPSQISVMAFYCPVNVKML